MIGITKEIIDGGILEDKQWKNPRRFRLKNRLTKNSKIVLYLLGAFLVFSIANATLIYSFYKILIKL